MNQNGTIQMLPWWAFLVNPAAATAYSASQGQPQQAGQQIAASVSDWWDRELPFVKRYSVSAALIVLIMALVYALVVRS